MRHFHHATLRLTVLYIALLMCLSFGCSIWLYQVAGREIQSVTLEDNGSQYYNSDSSNTSQNSFLVVDMSKERIKRDLVFFNLIVFGAGTILSYLLARRTLKPIEKNYQLQEEFASNASHELRTPLASLRAELQLVDRDSQATEATFRTAIKSSLEEVDRLIDLSSRLLVLSAPQHSGGHQASSLLAITNSVTRLLQPRIVEKKLVIEQPTEDIKLSIDTYNLREILTILLDNAIKFSPAGSVVIVAAEARHNNAIISMTNNGPTIPKEDLSRIFDRFYRGSHNSGAPGHGLGLSIARKLVSGAGGTIGVESLQGVTTFTVTFPS